MNEFCDTIKTLNRLSSPRQLLDIFDWSDETREKLSGASLIENPTCTSSGGDMLYQVTATYGEKRHDIYEVTQTGIIGQDLRVRVMELGNLALFNGHWVDTICNSRGCSIQGTSCFDDLSCPNKIVWCSGHRFIDMETGVLITTCGDNLAVTVDGNQVEIQGTHFIQWNSSVDHVTIGSRTIVNPVTNMVNRTVSFQTTSYDHTTLSIHSNTSHYIQRIIKQNYQEADLINNVKFEKLDNRISFLQILYYIGVGFVALFVLVFVLLMLKIFNSIFSIVAGQSRREELYPL